MEHVWKTHRMDRAGAEQWQTEGLVVGTLKSAPLTAVLVLVITRPPIGLLVDVGLSWLYAGIIALCVFVFHLVWAWRMTGRRGFRVSDSGFEVLTSGAVVTSYPRATVERIEVEVTRRGFGLHTLFELLAGLPSAKVRVFSKGRADEPDVYKLRMPIDRQHASLVEFAEAAAARLGATFESIGR